MEITLGLVHEERIASKGSRVLVNNQGPIFTVI